MFANSHRRRIASVFLCFFGLVSCFGPVRLASAAPARFWISLSDTLTDGPEVPVLGLEEGTTRSIYIWARPQTNDADGSFQNLRNLSLNLISNETVPNIFDIEDNFQINNPGNRFELIRDSDSPLDNPISSTNGPNDSVMGISAAIAQTAMFDGIGNGGGDNTCSVGVSCDPAWLIAQFDLTGLATSGSANLRMQIGSLGMNHDGDFSENTNVIFGEDQPGPTYNAKLNRDFTFGIDTADLVLNAIPVITGDFNSNGFVDGGDFLTWQRGGSPTPLSSFDLAKWEANFGNAASVGTILSTASVPEPASIGLVAAGLLLMSMNDRRRYILKKVQR